MGVVLEMHRIRSNIFAVIVSLLINRFQYNCNEMHFYCNRMHKSKKQKPSQKKLSAKVVELLIDKQVKHILFSLIYSALVT